MKNRLLLIGLTLAASVILAQAQIAQHTAFSVGSSSTGYTVGTSNFVVAAANGTTVNAQGYGLNTPMATYVNAKSDLAGSVLTLYYAQGQSAVYATNSTTALYVNQTNGLNLNYPLVIAHAGGIDEIRIATAAVPYTTNSTVSPFFPYNTNSVVTWNVTLGAAPTYAALPGDQVYFYATQGTIPVGAATLTLGPAPYVLAGQFQTPLLLGLNFTTAGAINIVTGEFK